MNGALDRWITGNYGEDHPDNQPEQTEEEDTMFEFIYWNDDPKIVAQFEVVAHWKDANCKALRVTIIRDDKVCDTWDFGLTTLLESKHRRQDVREILSDALAWACEEEQAMPRGHVPPIPWATFGAQ